MRGWYVHANDPQREILKKERPSYYRINHFQTRELLHLSRQLFAVINNGVFAGILSFARSQIIQTNPGSGERGHICEFPLGVDGRDIASLTAHSHPAKVELRRWTRSLVN